MLFIVLCFLLVVASSSGSYENAESRLINALMNSGYDARARPVKNITHPLTVKIGLVSRRIVNIWDDDKGIEMHSWLRLEWKDEFLNWEPADYAGVKKVILDIDSIYMPDITLYNSGDVFDMPSPKGYKPVLYSDGSVTAILPITTMSDCNVTKGETEVKCVIKFGSWANSGMEIDVQPTEPDAKEMAGNPKWTLKEITAERVEKRFECCPEPYPAIHFNMLIEVKNED